MVGVPFIMELRFPPSQELTSTDEVDKTWLIKANAAHCRPGIRDKIKLQGVSNFSIGFLRHVS